MGIITIRNRNEPTPTRLATFREYLHGKTSAWGSIRKPIRETTAKVKPYQAANMTNPNRRFLPERQTTKSVPPIVQASATDRNQILLETSSKPISQLQPARKWMTMEITMT